MDWVHEFMINCKARGLSAKTIEVYSNWLVRARGFVAGEGLAELDQAEPTHLRHFLAALQEAHPSYHFRSQSSVKSQLAAQRHLSPFTVHQAFRVLNTFYHFLEREGRIAQNPMAKLDPPKTPHHLVPRLDVVQARRLLRLIDQTTAYHERNLAIALLMLDSGLRVGEVVGLRREGLQLAMRKITVRGKGDKEREVPISPLTRQALERYLKVRGSHPAPWVFLNRFDEPLTKTGIEDVFRRLEPKLGAEIWPHLLRHSFAKQYLAGDRGDLRTLQAILGHEDISTTAMFYLDPDFDDLKRKHRRAAPSVRIKFKIKSRRKRASKKKSPSPEEQPKERNHGHRTGDSALPSGHPSPAAESANLPAL